jgi:hypothetical protein
MLSILVFEIKKEKTQTNKNINNNFHYLVVEKHNNINRFC